MMRNLIPRFVVAILAITVGLGITHIRRSLSRSERTISALAIPNAIEPQLLRKTEEKLTKSEARRRFEEFVIENGYTDLPPTEDETMLVPEPLFGIDLEARHNTLEQTPIDVINGNRFYKDGWSAFFLYKQPCRYCRPNTGRLIYMDANGKNMRVEHQDFVFTGQTNSRRKKP